MLNGNFIKGLLIKLRLWLFVNASGASGPLHNRDRARFGCILGEIGAFGPRRPWLASPAMRLLGPHAPISPRMHPKRALSLNYSRTLTSQEHYDDRSCARPLLSLAKTFR